MSINTLLSNDVILSKLVDIIDAKSGLGTWIQVSNSTTSFSASGMTFDASTPYQIWVNGNQVCVLIPAYINFGGTATTNPPTASSTQILTAYLPPANQIAGVGSVFDQSALTTNAGSCFISVQTTGEININFPIIPYPVEGNLNFVAIPPLFYFTAPL